jgi:hypothetical protein
MSTYLDKMIIMQSKHTIQQRILSPSIFQRDVRRQLRRSRVGRTIFCIHFEERTRNDAKTCS